MATQSRKLTPANREMVDTVFHQATETGMYVLTGAATAADPTGAPEGGRIRKLVPMRELIASILRWQDMGRTVTAIEHHRGH